MNCPVCGTVCAESVNYCPTCGTPLQPQTPEPAPVYSDPMPVAVPQYQPQAQPQVQTQVQPQVQPQVQTMPAYTEPVQQGIPQYVDPQQQYQPTQQMPSAQYGQQQAYVTQQYAVPMNQGIPPMGRTIEIEKKKSPKWPIVLIVLLLLLIAAAVALIILQPWNTKVDDGSATVSDGNVVVTSQSAESSQDVVVIGETQTPQVVDQQVGTPAASSDEQVYSQLVGAYDSFSGYDGRIGEVVDFFNAYYPDSADAGQLQSELATAQAIQSELANQANVLNGIVLPEGSAYAQALQNMKTLNNDLYMRVTDLVDSLSAWISGNMDAAAEALVRHNGEGGVSTYKAEYLNLYPNARP